MVVNTAEVTRAVGTGAGIVAPNIAMARVAAITGVGTVAVITAVDTVGPILIKESIPVTAAIQVMGDIRTTAVNLVMGAIHAIVASAAKEKATMADN